MVLQFEWLYEVFRYFSYIVAIHWGIISCYTIVGIVGFLLYNHTKKSLVEEQNVELCIVSKASEDVEEQLFYNIAWYHSKMFPEYRINIIVDDGCHSLLRLKAVAEENKSLSLIVVPKSYKIRAIAKGRAMQYFIETSIDDDRWYVFIDDDNRILDRKFLKEIPYYNARGYGAGNGILMPRSSGNNITFVADHLRYSDDITLFRFCSGLCKTPLNGFHGELLISKGRNLREISFDRKTVTEDFSYARELTKRKIKIWQSATKTSIFSPVSVRDFLKQRNRWYRGISRDVLHSNWKMKLFVGIRVIDWKIGIIGSWFIFPLWFFMPIPLWLIAFNLIGSFYYYISYVYGVSKLKSPLEYLTGIVCIPLYSIMETLSPWIKTKGFNVIDKNGKNGAKSGIRYL